MTKTCEECSRKFHPDARPGSVTLRFRGGSYYFCSRRCHDAKLKRILTRIISDEDGFVCEECKAAGITPSDQARFNKARRDVVQGWVDAALYKGNG